MRVADWLDGAAGAPTESFIGSKIGQHSQIITGTVCTILGRRQPTRRGTMGGVSSGRWFLYGPGPVRLRRSSACSFVRRVRGGPFRMIELNIVGWSALLAPSALIGGLVALALGRPVAVGALGVAGAALVVAVAWDRWRWCNSMVSVSSDLDLDELRRVVGRLRVEGVDVTPRCRRFRPGRGAGLRPQRGRRSEAHHTSALGEPSHRRARRRVGGSASRLTNTSAGNREQVREFHREQLRDVGVPPAATRWVAVGRVPWWRHVVVRPLWQADASGGTRADDPVDTWGTIMQVKAGRFFNFE